MPLVVAIGASGTIRALHHDAFSLGFLGRQYIDRASDIRWNTEAQAWDIWFADHGEFRKPEKVYCGFATYEKARSFEVSIMNFCIAENTTPFRPDALAKAGRLLRQLRRKG